MILAAGLGTRMKHLTEHTPKPLLPVFNLPLIYYQLFQLESFGISEVVINLHHLGEHIEAKIGNRFGEMKIHYSKEHPEILGTGGGLKKVSSFFKDEETFLLLNSDFISDLDFRSALTQHKKNNPLATLFVRKRTGHYNGLNIDKDLFIKDFSESGPYMFCGAHILTPKVIDFLPSSPSCIIENGYKRIMSEGGQIQAYLHNLTWYDFGTIEEYLDLQLEILNNLSQNPLIMRTLKHFVPNIHQSTNGIWIEDKASISENAILVPPLFIGNNVTIEDGARVGPKVILSPNSHIKAKTEIQESLVLENKIIKVTD